MDANADADANANANADAGSAIAFPGLRPGELKTRFEAANLQK